MNTVHSSFDPLITGSELAYSADLNEIFHSASNMISKELSSNHQVKIFRLEAFLMDCGMGKKESAVGRKRNMPVEQMLVVYEKFPVTELDFRNKLDSLREWMPETGALVLGSPDFASGYCHPMNYLYEEGLRLLDRIQSKDAHSGTCRNKISDIASSYGFGIHTIRRSQSRFLQDASRSFLSSTLRENTEALVISGKIASLELESLILSIESVEKDLEYLITSPAFRFVVLKPIMKSQENEK